MRELKQGIIKFWKADFEVRSYLIFGLYLAAALFVNYSPAVDLWQLQPGASAVQQAAFNFSLLGGTYYFVAVFARPKHGPNYVADPLFWALSLMVIGLVMLPKVHALHPLQFRAIEGLSLGEKVFGSRCSFFVTQGVVAFVGLLVLGIFKSDFLPQNLGFFATQWRARPYLIILGMVLPLVLVASFAPDFQRAYPQYKAFAYGEVFGLSAPRQAAIFEMCYGSAFVTVELLFRGALVIGMAKIMGPRAILPAVAMYCTFHFGKPLGESIGSVVGGWLLSVIALNTRSIKGGIIVHLGVAWAMEMAAYAQHLLR